MVKKWAIESKPLPPPEYGITFIGRGKPPLWPIPRGGGRRPFDKLKVGQSIRDDISRLNGLRAMAYQFKRVNPGWDYATRREGERRWRLWRVA